MKKSLILIAVISFLLPACSPKSERQTESPIKNDKIYVYQGIKFIQQKDFEKAAKLFNAAVLVNPYNDTAYTLLGKIYIEKKQYNKAIRILTPGLTFLPNNGEIPFLLAQAFENMGEFEKAFTAVKRSIEIYEAWQKKEKLKESQILMLRIVKEMKK